MINAGRDQNSIWFLDSSLAAPKCFCRSGTTPEEEVDRCKRTVTIASRIVMEAGEVVQ